MTGLPTWRIDGEQAHLHSGALAATVDIARPHLGLHCVRIRGAEIVDANLLAPAFANADDAPAVGDCVVRGRDLIVTYAPTRAHPVRLQVYWRASGDAHDGVARTAIDMQVSVQTSLLDAWPALEVKSRLPTIDIFRLTHGSPEPGRVPLDAGNSAGTASSDGPSCWFCRLSNAGSIYAEMVHPADVDRETVSSAGAQSIEIAHRLFAQPLEKGVILRARAGGVFIERGAAARDSVCTEQEIEMVAEEYARFLAAPLPLTT